MDVIPDLYPQVPVLLIIRIVQILLKAFIVLINDGFRHQGIVGIVFDQLPTELSPRASTGVGRVRVIAETGVEALDIEIVKQVHLVKLLLEEQPQVGPFGSTTLEVKRGKDVEVNCVPDLVLLKLRVGRALVLEETVGLFVVLVVP